MLQSLPHPSLTEEEVLGIKCILLPQINWRLRERMLLLTQDSQSNEEWMQVRMKVLIMFTVTQFPVSLPLTRGEQPSAEEWESAVMSKQHKDDRTHINYSMFMYNAHVSRRANAALSQVKLYQYSTTSGNKSHLVD